MRLLGVGIPGPLSLVGATVGTVRGLAGLATRPRRHVWSCPGRLHIEAHGVHAEGSESVARGVERALERHPGVLWARVNAPSSRVIVAVDDPPPRTSELIRIVAEAESEPPSADEEAAEDELHHPADGVRGTRLVPTLAADAFGLAMSAITRLAPWAPIPGELAALPSVVNHHPALRARLARGTHSKERADSVTSVLGAVAQGLSGGGEGAVLDAVQRMGQWQEARAHERAWCEAEGSLITGPGSAAAQPSPPRRPMPEGQVEHYERRMLALGAAAGAVAAPFAGPRKAAALGLATLPKSAEVGRSVFASSLGRILANRGAIVMDRSALRALDRIDTLVLDQSSLETGRQVLADLVPLPGSDQHAVAELAWRLFDPAAPTAVRSEDDWRLGPLDELPVQGRTGARERARLEKRGATAVLGLAQGSRLQAVVALRGEPVPGVHTLSAAAERSALRVEHTTNARDCVRDLHEQGRVVLLVSGDPGALGAADCGVGTYRAGDCPPWGAHVLVGEDVGTLALLVESVTAMRAVNGESIRIAQASSGVGVVTALQGGRRASPVSRGMRAVHAGAAIALVNARRRARGLRVPEGAVPETVPWHLMPAAAVLDRLGRKEGLTEAEAQRRARTRGGARPERTSLGSAFLAELSNPLTPVLAGGAALSAAVGSPVDAALVGGVTGLSALIGSVQQVRTERELAELLSRSSVSATVLRDGDERMVTADDLVPGDVVALAAGDVVPADCRLLEAEGLEVDESSLTGESLPVAKDPAPVVAADIAERSSMVYEGTTVAAGEASAVVVAVGDDTEAGRSMAIARENGPSTGVETRLAELTEKSMPLAVGSAAAVAGAGLVRGIPLRESLGAAVNLAVASVPEGLPFLVNAAQLAAARRLAEHGALVRNQRSIEALGRVDVLCFDKTGTLTEGRLSVSEIDDGSTRSRIDKLGESLRPVLAAALRATPEAEDAGELPHATDRAIVEAGQRLRMNAAAGIQGWRPVSSAPFEPSRGYHAVIGTTRKGPLLSVKGAPEEVLPRCDLDQGTRKKLNGRMRALAEAGHRVLAVAERRVETQEATEDSVRDLTFLGFVAISDPVRGSAAPAAARLREAGVHIVMITGDHPVTGEAIATQVNGEGELRTVTGAELDELDDDRLRETLPEVDVVARCSPAQKVRIIKAYQALGKTVAMTGDGANDAPAIRLADVGIALGGHGTPAARAAADVVVTDDRLETIIAALIEGRAMWASVRSALGVLLGGNLGEIGFNVLGAALTGRSPLGARQLLLVNLLTDLAPSLAIALRRPAETTVDDLLREGPESSLGTRLYKEIGVRAGATTAGATAAWSLARVTGRRRRADTVALAALVGSQLGQTLLSGGRSPAVLASGLGSAAVLAAVIQTPGVSRFFGCTPLGPVGWTIALGSAGAASVLGTAAG
ncbi:cation-translocating P-type ATPase [Prauserella muralis]|uniref:Haloacid dehalogenase n=1 Tax=Prauserella muralis TaxID=588067 RepID=A0A2V4ALY9_9PSEU|nr:cation-transporting P-type ATPase [Prauserella muralis]PXY21004.1 haloacid dehalogenase [Prauserella muralis]TWE30074.1 calcium-translocating P-type ATPase [Prauserella muralis]